MAQHFDHVEGSGESSLLGLLVAGTVRSWLRVFGHSHYGLLQG